jgi:hypothetical protein
MGPVRAGGVPWPAEPLIRGAAHGENAGPETGPVSKNQTRGPATAHQEWATRGVIVAHRRLPDPNIVVRRRDSVEEE